MCKPTSTGANSASSTVGSIRVERLGSHEWNVYLTVPSEWGSFEQLIDDIDDCGTEEQALTAARQMLEARGWL